MKYSPWFEYPQYRPAHVGRYDCKCGKRHWRNGRRWTNHAEAGDVWYTQIVWRGLERKPK